MQWFLSGDASEPLITAAKHIKSAHGDDRIVSLPETCVLFEMGGALSFLKAERGAHVMTDHLPCFIADSECVTLPDQPDICYVKGGYGAPAAIDTLETVLALGVKQIIVAGLCGGFAQQIEVGDVVIPNRILCEEGTSHHYYERIEYAEPDGRLFDAAKLHFADFGTIHTASTVTSDSFYRQTYAKEAHWRQRGIVGVDMESSALLSVSRYYGIPAVSMLLCSDKHPISKDEVGWQWGKSGFRETRKRFVEHVVAFADVVASSLKNEDV